MDKGALEEELAAREEALLVDQFRRNLEFNLKKVSLSSLFCFKKVVFAANLKNMAHTAWGSLRLRCGPPIQYCYSRSCLLPLGVMPTHSPLPPAPAPPLQTGTTLHRDSRKKHPAKRPEGGWGLLVKPLGKAAKAAERQPFVAMPDGKQRVRALPPAGRWALQLKAHACDCSTRSAAARCSR